MTKTYKLELEIVLDEEQRERVVELARRLYAANPGSTEDENGVDRELSAEEFIDATSRALMTIAEENPLLEELDVHVSEPSCTGPDYQASEDNAPAIPMGRRSGPHELRKKDEEALDEWEDGLYLCRWPNGEFSIVKAASKREGGKTSAKTTFIQRLNTKRGSAPPSGCSVFADVSKQVLVPYSAEYFFFRADQ
jgi:hypothetical protein